MGSYAKDDRKEFILMTRSSNNFCGSPEHGLSRRGFLGAAAAAGAATFAADMTTLDVLKNPALAGELKRQQKNVIVLLKPQPWQPKRKTVASLSLVKNPSRKN